MNFKRPISNHTCNVKLQGFSSEINSNCEFYCRIIQMSNFPKTKLFFRLQPVARGHLQRRRRLLRLRRSERPRERERRRPQPRLSETVRRSVKTRGSFVPRKTAGNFVRYLANLNLFFFQQD